MDSCRRLLPFLFTLVLVVVPATPLLADDDADPDFSAAIKLLNTAHPPGSATIVGQMLLAAKKVVDARMGYLSGSIDIPTYQRMMNDAIALFDAATAQIEALIKSGQIREPLAGQLRDLLAKIRRILLELLVCVTRPEICDGRDNNCNHQIDENPVDAGGPCTSGRGACARIGTTVCQAGALSCNAIPGQPAPEVCDGVDNDCNGAIDDGNAGAGTPCNTGGVGVCGPGTTACIGGAIVCSPNAQSGPELCDGLDNNCDGHVDEGNPGGGVPCNTGKLGACSAGTTACSNGSIVCNQNVQPRDEICDGIDNDCDGRTDEDLGATTCGVGDCENKVENCIGGVPQTCTPRSPRPETCDGRDNDCNGVVDDGLGTITCGVGACQRTVEACSGGTAKTCTPGTPVGETCDGIDNDCDGVIDNGNPAGGHDCNTGQPGVCGTGTTACTNGHVVCQQTTSPTAETCNGLDDNCNGAVDEGNPGGGIDCATGKLGICAAGVTHCTEGHIVCQQKDQPHDETCNFEDDDCDGEIDEGLGTITCGYGACARTVPKCSGGEPTTCVPGSPTEEICDGIDNDCNGVIDDDLGTITCGVGACQRTVEFCVNGEVQKCAIGVPQPETCDGIDNDCDGDIDDGNPGGGLPCNTGQLGICAVGTTTCTNSGIVCNQTVQPAAEVCNGLDDDCDGLVDEDLGTITCGVGACERTVVACVDGEVQKCAMGIPEPEVCDGIDNNCDGQIDEGTTSCGVGACERTVPACAGGEPNFCTPGSPTQETCDGIDNDCDGVIDNGNPGGGVSCPTGQPGICAVGKTMCSGGSLRCVQTVQPGVEVCNGLDDNCNGAIDEGTGGAFCTTGQFGICAPGTTQCVNGRLTCVPINSGCSQ